VRWRRETVFHKLIGVYRDPYTAKLQLDEMVKRQGLTSTAARIAQDPRRLGELLGRMGLFARARAKPERTTAEEPSRLIWSGSPGRRRGPRNVSEQRGSAARGRRHSHSEAQRARRGSSCHTRDDKARAALWRGVTVDPTLGPELQRFSKAALQRFGAEAVRTLLHSPGGLAEAPSLHASTIPCSPASAGPCIPSCPDDSARNGSRCGEKPVQPPGRCCPAVLPGRRDE
jgi:hypothetical protein